MVFAIPSILLFTAVTVLHDPTNRDSAPPNADSIAHPPRGNTAGDCNGDRLNSLIDHRSFRRCMAGPGEAVASNCRCADFDGDGDVDLSDAAAQQLHFDGRPIPESCSPAAPACNASHATPGCNHVDCCQAVCETDPFCCQTAWDSTCVGDAVRVCRTLPGPPGDSCAAPLSLAEGSRAVTNRIADTDGIDLAGSCRSVRLGSDVWFCHTAACDGFLIVALCGSTYDTAVAVYHGCGCPGFPAIACSDDDCGIWFHALDSRAVVPTAAGQTFTIRVGGFVNPVTGQAAEGDGVLTVLCSADPANSAACTGGESCFQSSSSPGCGDTPCCLETCANDPYCCDVQWNDACAAEALGLCAGDFPVCGPPNDQPCTGAGLRPGCADDDCCQSVCRDDPFCCLLEWDSTCAGQADLLPECK